MFLSFIDKEILTLRKIQMYDLLLGDLREADSILCFDTSHILKSNVLLNYSLPTRSIINLFDKRILT